MMNDKTTPLFQSEPDYNPAQIQSNLRQLERRDLWVWGNAILIILSLTATVVALSVSLHPKSQRTIFGLNLRAAVWALIVLILIFTGQMIYQHLHLRKIQRALAEHQIQAELFRRLAMFDPLTGLYNRRFAEHRLRAEIARSERKGFSMIVVLLGLNNLKQISDNYCQAAGDSTLQQFAKHLNRSTRGSDMVARWNEDEFILLLLDCEANQMSSILPRLKGLQIEFQGKPLAVTCSAGWQAFQPGDKFEALIEQAERNLHAHKAGTITPGSSQTTPA